MLAQNVVVLLSSLILCVTAEIARIARSPQCDVSTLKSCYGEYFAHFGMTADRFPSHERFVARTETYMTNEPILARPTLCDWHRTLARCLGPNLRRACVSKDSLKASFGLSNYDAFNYALSFESNEFECGEAFPTISAYFDCLEEVRTCDRSEVDAAVQGCSNMRRSEFGKIKNLKGADRKCKLERLASECMIQFVVSKCGKAVEKYYCKVQEFVGKKKRFDDASICPEAYRCNL